MKPFNFLSEAKRRKFLEKKIWAFHDNLAKQARVLPDSVFSALHTLQDVRMEHYEDLNQLLHATAIMTAFEELCGQHKPYAKLQWEWNPCQQGGKDEPDLRCRMKGKVVASVEVNTSHDAKGATRKTLMNTCKKLSGMEGRKIFFVANEDTEAFLKRFIEKSKLNVEVNSLNIRRHARQSPALHESL